MKLILKSILTLAACTGLTTSALADPVECDQLQTYWTTLVGAHSAEDAFGYALKLDTAQQEYYACLSHGWAQSDPAEWARNCEYDYNDKLYGIGGIEEEYTDLHEAVLAATVDYESYLAYLMSQQIYCSIS